MNEHRRNDGFRRVYMANEKTGRLNQTLVCTLCSAPFKKLCNMKDHLRMHKGEKPYECRLCGLKFAQQGNRDRHEKRKICLCEGGVDEEEEEEYIGSSFHGEDSLIEE
jgi:uncharacterized Zn-finger protein